MAHTESMRVSASTREKLFFTVLQSFLPYFIIFSSVTCRFAQDDGTVLKTEKVSKDPSPGVFKTIAPSGATKIELSSGVNFTLPEKTVANGSRRIYLNNSNNTYKEAYAYSW